MDALNVALIGTGYIGKSHALAFRNAPALFPGVPPARLASICDIAAGRAKKMRDEFDFAADTTRWRDVVEDPAIDIVAIATPNHLHRDIAVEALKRGKHVYCEKPMGVTLADAEAMAAAAAAQPGAVTMLAYNYLKNPAFAHACKLVREGRIGRVFYFRGVNEEEYLADGDIALSWRCRKTDAGTGALGDLGSHLISMAHALLGPPREIAATMQTAHERRPVAAGARETGAVENEDVAHALLNFDGGVTGSLVTSRVSWGRKNRLAFEIYGEKGSIAFDQERMNELEIFEPGACAAENGFRRILIGPDHPPYNHFVPSAGHQIGFNDLKTIEIAMFLEAVAGGAAPLYPTFEDGVAIERTIAAVVEAAETRRWIAVDASV